jgi:hypothetical protein
MTSVFKTSTAMLLIGYFVSSICGADPMTLADAQAKITNFHVASVNAAGQPVVMRGARPGYSGALANDVQILSDIGARTVIDLQGGDITVNILPPSSQPSSEESYAYKSLSASIRIANRYLEPGEVQKNIDAERNAIQNLNTGISFLNYPLNSVQPIDAPGAAAIVSILKIMSTPESQPVYVHCEHGHDRTGMIVALYQVCFEHKPPADAYNEMLMMGHNPDDHVTESTDIFFWRSVASPDFCKSVGG